MLLGSSGGWSSSVLAAARKKERSSFRGQGHCLHCLSRVLNCTVDLMLSREAEQLLLARGNLQINKLLSVKHFEDGKPCAAPQDYYYMALTPLMGFQSPYFPSDL